jgi:hypothetical protein
LIDPARSGRLHINLLQRDEVGSRGCDEGGDAFEIEHAIDPFAVVNVVCEHTERASVCPWLTSHIGLR